jgi:excisionase family DNA binding protein
MSRPERADKIAALLAQLVDLLAEEHQPQIPEPRVSPERTLLTIEEAAERLQIGRTRMFSLVKSGEIDSVLIGRLRRIHPDSIEDFARRNLGDGTRETQQPRSKYTSED